MVSNVIEAPVSAVGLGGKPEEQKTDGADFMSIILSMFSAQPGLAGPSLQAPGVDPNAQTGPAGQLPDGKTAEADAGGKQALTAQAASAETTDAAKAAPAVDGRTAVAPKMLEEQPVTAAQTGREDSQAAVQAGGKPAADQMADPGVARALIGMTSENPAAVVLPEAATPSGEIAASLVAHRLNPTGQNAQRGEVLPDASADAILRQAQDALRQAQDAARANDAGPAQSALKAEDPAALRQGRDAAKGADAAILRQAQDAARDQDALRQAQGAGRAQDADTSGAPPAQVAVKADAVAARQAPRPSTEQHRGQINAPRAQAEVKPGDAVQIAAAEGNPRDFLAFAGRQQTESRGESIKADASLDAVAIRQTQGAVSGQGAAPVQGSVSDQAAVFGQSAVQGGQQAQGPVDHSAVARAVMDPAVGESVVQQIVREVTLHKLGETTTLSVRLDPPELGTLRINVSSQSGALTTQIESPHAAVRSMLETHIPALREALSSAGIEVGRFSVSSGLDFGQQAQRQQQAWQPARLAPAVEFAGQPVDQPITEAASAVRSSAGHSWLA